ncbi:unnamed protein product, partial [Allacma fusca]
IILESYGESNYDRITVNDIRRSILAISQEHSSKYWIIVLCAELFMKIPKHLQKTYYGTESLSDWLVKNYLCCRQNIRWYFGILRILFQYGDTRDTSLDQKCIRKVFACTAEQERGKLWEDVRRITDHIHDHQRMFFFQQFFSTTEMNLFTQSLQIGDELLLQDFLTHWCSYFCGIQGNF